ncbi:hypothetical protein [Falsirhodobacter sp. alg1]|nr:hypothetical protein [Falsirhodobacter sp. alg1]
MSHPILLACLLAFVAFTTMSGCGVDGEPIAPNGSDTFPAETVAEINR